MSSHSSNYAGFKEKQFELAGLLDEAHGAIELLKLEKDQKYLRSLSEKVRQDSFKIQIVGTFKNGKSTFINSFLGEEILPAYATPCTALINEVKYGKETRALLYFRKDLPKELPKNLPDKICRHIDRYRDTEIPAIDIPYDELEKFAVIPTGADPKEMLLESPYEKIELFWPLELLENGVEIVDSPGLNEHAIRTHVTLGYLNKADAILFILVADKLCSADEMHFVENNLKKNGFDSVYFIVNRFDTLRTDSDRKRVIDFAKMKLREFTSFGEGGLYFISARDALDGKLDNDSALYNSSGMPEFEETLSIFLVEEKGRVKLSQPAKEVKRILETEVIQKAIPQHRGMLESSLHELLSRRDDALPKLDALKNKLTTTRERIHKQIDQAIPDIRFAMNRYYADLNANIQSWISAYEPGTSIGIFSAKSNAEPMMNEILDFIKDKIAEDQADWSNNTLSPLIQNKIESIMTSNEVTFENFFLELDNIKISLAGVAVSNEGDAPIGERLLAAGAGFIATGPAGAALGGMQGFTSDFVKGLVTQFAILAGLAIFGLLNPVTLLALIGGSLVFGGMGAADKIKAKIKSEVTRGILDQINQSANDSIEKVLAGLHPKLRQAFEQLLTGMDAQVREVEAHVDSVIEELKQGEQERDRQLALLTNCEQQVQELNNRVSEFIAVNIERK